MCDPRSAVHCRGDSVWRTYYCAEVPPRAGQYVMAAILVSMLGASPFAKEIASISFPFILQIMVGFRLMCLENVVMPEREEQKKEADRPRQTAPARQPQTDSQRERESKKKQDGDEERQAGTYRQRKSRRDSKLTTLLSGTHQLCILDDPKCVDSNWKLGSFLGRPNVMSWRIGSRC